MEPDDVVIADIAGQALDIFLHGPESAHKNGIVKTFTHTSIPIHPCTLLKKKKEKKRKKKGKNAQLTKHDAFLYWSSSCRCSGCRLAGSLAPPPLRRPCRLGQFEQKTFVKVFNKFSNIARQKKTFNSPNMMPLFTGPLPVQCGGGRRPGSLADAPQDSSTSEDFSPRTVLTENICRCVQHILQHFPITMPFLTALTITFSWMASTAPQADSW